MTIDIAVVPVAGHGTRLLPLTKSQPKEMLSVGRKPVVQYVVEELALSGIRRLLFITSHGKAVEDVKNALADLVDFEEAPNILVEPVVASDDDEEIIVEAIPVATETVPTLADTDQDVATDDTGEDFLAALAGTIDSDEEEKPTTPQAEESAESVDADLNDFFKNFD